MASAKGKEKSGIDKQNTVDTHLPPIVFIQTRYCWLGYKQWGDTIGKYIPELERKVGQKPGGRGFKFGYQVLQKDEKKNPGRDPKNVDLDLTCFKCVAKPKPLAAKVAHTSSGESTDTKFGDFMELFCGEEGVLTKINGKLFSVTDANYAHNVAAAVACKTFGDNTKEGKKRLIVNFDQHEDFGFIKGGADILCSNWGGFCLRRDMKGYASGIADAYLVIGTGKTKEQCEHVFYEIARDGKTSKKTKQTGNKDIDTLKFIDSSQKENFWKDWCVFVTVDRDFFIGNGTEWGDGAFMPEDGRTRIEKILYHLKKNGASFVGFDVCGVPELAGSETDSSSKKRTTTAQKQGLGIDASGFRDRLATDIAFLWNLFKTLTR